MTAERGNGGKEGKGENEYIRGRETLPSSGNTPTIVCASVCAHTCVFVCALCLGQTDTPTGCRPLYPVQVVRLSKHHALTHLLPSFCSPFPTGLTLMGVEAVEGVGTVNRTKPPF